MVEMVNSISAYDFVDFSIGNAYALSSTLQLEVKI